MCCETSWDIKIKKWWCVTIFNHFKGSRTWQEALSTQWIGAAERLKWFFLCDDRSNRISFFGRWLFKSHFFFLRWLFTSSFLRWLFKSRFCLAIIVYIAAIFCDDCSQVFFAIIVQIAFFGDAGSFSFFAKNVQTQFSRIIFGKVRRHQSPNAFLQVAICIFELPFLIAQLQKRKLYIFFVFFLRFFFP